MALILLHQPFLKHMDKIVTKQDFAIVWEHLQNFT